VIMPNSKVWGSKIINYSLSKRRRLELLLKVREDDVRPAIDAITTALAEDNRVLKNPEPVVRVSSIADGAVALGVWIWTNPEDFQSVSSDEYLRIWNQFRQAELQIL
jgi:small conductance mechanosensitive channel